MRPGIPERRTRDHLRRGVTSLFPSIDVATGRVIGACHRRHRHQRFLRLLRRIDAEVSAELAIHLVMDNYAALKQPAEKRWFEQHLILIIHSTPTSESWLYQVERFFSEITRRRIRRETFTSVLDFERAIRDYVVDRDVKAKSFAWNATLDRR